MCSFPLKHTLGNGCHCGIVSPFNVLQKFGELGVVVPNFWRPDDSRSLCIIPGKHAFGARKPGQETKRNSPLLDWNSHLSVPRVTQTPIERWVWHRLRKMSRRNGGQFKCSLNFLRCLHKWERDQFLSRITLWFNRMVAKCRIPRTTGHTNP
jgi:hypothetical protein